MSHRREWGLAREGRGSVCENYENFNGFTYGRFPCPLPASTGMNQLDQFCCGMANYQYCCNVQFVFDGNSMSVDLLFC